MAGESKTTTDHDVIRQWTEARGGKPSTVKSTESNGEAGVLRINFPGYSGENSLEDISWDEFFQKFDEKNLAFLYQEHTSGGEESRFFKLVSRGHAAHDTHRSQAETSHSHKADEKSSAHKAEHKSDTKASAHKDEKATSHKTEHKAEHKAEHKTEEKSSSKKK